MKVSEDFASSLKLNHNIIVSGISSKIHKNVRKKLFYDLAPYDLSKTPVQPSLCSSFCSASTVVWIMFELTLRPEYFQHIREEALNHADPLTLDLNALEIGTALQKATWLDSFIREVMRTKGDTLSMCRRTTIDTDMGGYTIPKGSVYSSKPSKLSRDLAILFILSQPLRT
ncbi:hypothetical protein MIND_01177600 [Mycena indigotica]|uniref:Uncharacterized protein n=1 Tax=Mycena indigotica TaxID=2126181 RepID=A0A8H6S4K3_9AGAR|nr:uncharacterized protein MIND_01177600 [Mycena indigotica]KAF7292789.1 hypothetical protein MIND_01177600 [Mycena indigotica]